MIRLRAVDEERERRHEMRHTPDEFIKKFFGQLASDYPRSAAWDEHPLQNVKKKEVDADAHVQ